MEDYAISFTDEGWWIFHEEIPKLDTENQQKFWKKLKHMKIKSRLLQKLSNICRSLR